MTELYLIRHGEAEGNLYRRIHGWTDGALTELGRKQAQLLAARFQDVKLDAVYSSDLSRARETAQPLAKAQGRRLRIRRDLREVNMGRWEDQCWGWAARFDGEQYDRLNQDPATWQVPGCERYADSLSRMRAALGEIAKKHPNGRVAVVSHGSAIRILLADLLGYPSHEIRRVPYCDNTAVARVTAGPEGLTLHEYNDNAHLPAALSAFHRDTWWQSEDARDGRDLYFLPMDVRSASGGETYLRRYRETWIASHGTDLGFTGIYLEKARASAAQDPWTVMEVWESDRPVGMLELAPRQGAAEGAGHIALLFLEESWRRRGLGVQLLGQAISYYRGKGRRYLRLRVADTNLHALRFYREWGFETLDTEQGALGETLVMTKNI